MPPFAKSPTMTDPKRRQAGDGRTWVSQFQSAYDEGRFRDAALLYGERGSRSDPPRVLILAARANMHTDPATALRLLLGSADNRFKGQEQVQRNIFLAEAFARTQDFDSADDRLEEALAVARRLSDADSLASVGYRYVRRYLLAEDAASARAYLEMAQAGKSRTSHIYALFAESVILSYEERVREQADRLIELLRLLDPAKPEFFEVRSWSTHTLAALARELFIPQAISEVDRQLSGLPWPQDFAQNEFQALKALGWAKAIRGDYFNAFRHLKRASVVVDTTAWKVVAACDRSYLARRFGEQRWSRVELDEAEQLASMVDWHATVGEERTGLLLLAELFTAIDISRAAMYLAGYRELGNIKSPLYYRSDARIAAFSQYSTGIVELALGNKKRGLSEFRAAREVFERFGYNFRAAQCLLEEFRVTANDEVLSLAAEKLHNYSESWLAAELRSLGGRPASDIKLPPMQRRVFDEVCKGKSSAQIAETLARSEFTVSNHIKQIFKAFNVGSRAALIAEAARRGML